MGKLLLFLILCAVSVPQMAPALDHDLDDALNNQFKDKILILRHPLGAESLRYDADGKSLNGGPQGPWTVYGGVLIKKVELGPNKLRLRGQRMFFRFESSQPVVYEFKLIENRPFPPVQPAVNVEIKVDQPLQSVDQARTVLDKVFALNKQDFLDSVPEFWRRYLAGFSYDPGQSKQMEFKAAEMDRRSSPPNQTGAAGEIDPQESAEAGETVYRMGKDVKAPKGKLTPEPEFSDPARYEKFQGVLVVAVVVDKAGHVSKARVVRALGLGLEESAVARIKTWTFDPGTRNGEPVAVAMNVEVSFHLY